MAVVLAVLALAGVAGGGAWRLGEGILHAVACTAGDWCEHSDGLERAYGAGTAALVRRFAPDVIYERGSAELPVDFRRCRRNECSNGPDRPSPIDRSGAGLRVTAFTRVIDAAVRRGAATCSTGCTTRRASPAASGASSVRWQALAGPPCGRLGGLPGAIGPAGGMSSRATAHGGYRGFKHTEGWGPWTGPVPRVGRQPRRPPDHACRLASARPVARRSTSFRSERTSRSGPVRLRGHPAVGEGGLRRPGVGRVVGPEDGATDTLARRVGGAGRANHAGDGGALAGLFGIELL